MVLIPTNKIVNKTKNTVLAMNLETAQKAVSRFLGLMGRSGLKAGGGMWIMPCTSVHTFFMRFPIDVLFISRNMEVVGIKKNMKPWRISKIHIKSAQVIELPAGTLDRTGTQIGDVLEFKGVRIWN